MVLLASVVTHLFNNLVVCQFLQQPILHCFILVVCLWGYTFLNRSCHQIPPFQYSSLLGGWILLMVKMSVFHIGSKQVTGSRNRTTTRVWLSSSNLSRMDTLLWECRNGSVPPLLLGNGVIHRRLLKGHQNDLQQDEKVIMQKVLQYAPSMCRSSRTFTTLWAWTMWSFFWTLFSTQKVSLLTTSITFSLTSYLDCED